MKDDNTPTISARRRKQTPHMRLRTETAKTLLKLAARAKIKRAESKQQISAEKSENVHESRNSKKSDPKRAKAPRPKKNSLSEPVKSSSKFRKRQLNKSWLPTHLYHAKRAHITLPREPLWRFAIPLTPTDKSYRATHRAMASRGCVAWDTSYMSTISLEGAEASLLGLLRGFGIEEKMLAGKNASKWRRGTRMWEGWINERDGERRPIAAVRIVWCLCDKEQAVNLEDPGSQKKKARRKMILRVHPSAFLQVWKEALKIAKMQRPPVMAEDLRFELGSIDIAGPESTQALIGVLNPISTHVNESPQAAAFEKTWPLLGAVTNPGSLPANALLGFEISDPRLRHPPRTIPKLEVLETDAALLQILSDWPPDKTENPPTIFDRNTRHLASKSLPSQKSINRRKGAALPGEYPDLLPRDPRIPVILTASRSPSSACQGSWTVILPWKCVLPVWYSLMHFPLSSGGNPRFGGLQEQRQMAFEQGVPWFPGDFSGTKAGWEWEVQERDKRKADWEKRPKGKKIEWDSVDLGTGHKGEIGRGWACDWERLFHDPSMSNLDEPNVKIPTAAPVETAISEAAQPCPPKEPHFPPLNIYHIPSPGAILQLPPPTGLCTISLSLLSRGAPAACARIYRLPTKDTTLRAKWISLATTPKSPTSRHKRAAPATQPKDLPPHLRNQHLAASILAEPPIHEPQGQGNHTPHPRPQAGDPDYPSPPPEEDLIGFVTTGNFNLGEGRSSAIGCVALARIFAGEAEVDVEVRAGGLVGGAGKTALGGKGKSGWKRKLCVVRDAGQGVARVAKWEFAGGDGLKGGG